MLMLDTSDPTEKTKKKEKVGSVFSMHDNGWLDRYAFISFSFIVIGHQDGTVTYKGMVGGLNHNRRKEIRMR